MRANEIRRQACDDACNVPCFNEELVSALRASLPSDANLDAAATIFGALSDRTRLKLLDVFRSGKELCVCDVANVLGTSVSSASHHLRKLRDLKVLAYRNDGKMAYYSLRDQFVGDLANLALSRTSHRRKGRSR